MLSNQLCPSSSSKSRSNDSIFIIATLFLFACSSFPSLQHPCPHMVRLLHYYETSTHRIFLLLEYVGGGRLLDFVNGKRAQWKKLHEAATNPPPSSSLILSADTTTQEKPERDKSSPLVVLKEDTRADETGDTQANGGWVYNMHVHNTHVL